MASTFCVSCLSRVCLSVQLSRLQRQTWSSQNRNSPTTLTTRPFQTSRRAVAQGSKNSVDILPVFRYVSSSRIQITTNTTQAYRCRVNLAIEKLMLIVDPSSDVTQEKGILHIWLKQYLDFQKQSPAANVGSEGMTRSEELAAATYHAMALILRAARDQEQWTETDFQGTLEKYNKDLLDTFEEQLVLIENLKKPVPAFGCTLHVLYTAHEVGRTVVNFCKYLSKQSKDFVAKQKEASM